MPQDAWRIRKRVYGFLVLAIKFTEVLNFADFRFVNQEFMSKLMRQRKKNK